MTGRFILWAMPVDADQPCQVHLSNGRMLLPMSSSGVNIFVTPPQFSNEMRNMGFEAASDRINAISGPGAPISQGPTSDRPKNPTYGILIPAQQNGTPAVYGGTQYLDTDLWRVIEWDGSKWRDVATRKAV